MQQNKVAWKHVSRRREDANAGLFLLWRILLVWSIHCLTLGLIKAHY